MINENSRYFESGIGKRGRRSLCARLPVGALRRTIEFNVYGRGPRDARLVAPRHDEILVS